MHNFVHFFYRNLPTMIICGRTGNAYGLFWSHLCNSTTVMIFWRTQKKQNVNDVIEVILAVLSLCTSHVELLQQKVWASGICVFWGKFFHFSHNSRIFMCVFLFFCKIIRPLEMFWFLFFCFVGCYSPRDNVPVPLIYKMLSWLNCVYSCLIINVVECFVAGILLYASRW